MYWVSGNKASHHESNCNIYCKEMVLSTTRPIWTMRCVIDPTHWTLRSRLSYTSIIQHCFGRFRQHSLENSKRLDLVSAVRPTHKQLVSSVTISYVFKSKCAWHERPNILCNSSHWCREEAPEMYNADIMIVEELRTPSHALYLIIAVPVHKHGNSSTLGKSP